MGWTSFRDQLAALANELCPRRSAELLKQPTPLQPPGINYHHPTHPERLAHGQRHQ
jgi:hypothetical protein